MLSRSGRRETREVAVTRFGGLSFHAVPLIKTDEPREGQSGVAATNLKLAIGGFGLRQTTQLLVHTGEIAERYDVVGPTLQHLLEVSPRGAGFALAGQHDAQPIAHVEHPGPNTQGRFISTPCLGDLAGVFEHKPEAGVGQGQTGARANCEAGVLEEYRGGRAHITPAVNKGQTRHPPGRQYLDCRLIRATCGARIVCSQALVAFQHLVLGNGHALPMRLDRILFGG